LIVVDSSVLIGFLRGHNSPATAKFQSLEEEGIPFALPAICYQEVLQGAKDEREWKLLSEYLGSQELLFAHDAFAAHRQAARIYFDCRRKGLTLRSSIDCLIAYLVLEEDGVLLHDDEDFERIRQVRPLKTLYQ
jgi:predicted nucleic acid-binding protein